MRSGLPVIIRVFAPIVAACRTTLVLEPSINTTSVARRSGMPASRMLVASEIVATAVARCPACSSNRTSCWRCSQPGRRQLEDKPYHTDSRSSGRRPRALSERLSEALTPLAELVEEPPRFILGKTPFLSQKCRYPLRSYRYAITLAWRRRINLVVPSFDHGISRGSVDQEKGAMLLDDFERFR